MAQHDSDDLKNELTRLLAKSRQLRDRSGTLDEEIHRLTRIIAGTAGPAECASTEEESAAGEAASPRSISALEVESSPAARRSGARNETSERLEGRSAAENRIQKR